MTTNANKAGSYRLWTAEATWTLMRLSQLRIPRSEIAAILSRSPKAIKRKLEYERARYV